MKSYYKIKLIGISEIYKNRSVYLYASIIMLSFSSPAHAYLDPGSISLVLQTIFAGIAGIAATYRLWIYKFKSLFSSKEKKGLENQKQETNYTIINKDNE
jgi:hypothetical protein